MTDVIRPNQITDAILLTDSDYSLLFLGPPGVGKTAGVALAAVKIARMRGRVLVDLSGEAAGFARAEGVEVVRPRSQRELLAAYDMVRREPGRYFVFLRLVATHVTPEDIQYPRVVGGGAVTSMAPLKLAFLMEPVEGLLFIDEITNVRRDDAKTMFFAMVLERTVGLAGQLSEGVRVVAAGNTDRESDVAEPLPAPLIDRFAVFHVEPPRAEELAAWMARYVPGHDPAVPAFLLANPDAVYRPPREPAAFKRNLTTPRSWTALARVLPRARDSPLLPAIVRAYLDEETAGRFMAWLKVQPPDPREVLENPERWSELSLEQKLLLVMSIVANPEHPVDRVAKLLGRMVRAGDAEVAATMLRLMLDANPTRAAELAYAAHDYVPADEAAEALDRVREVLEAVKRAFRGDEGRG